MHSGGGKQSEQLEMTSTNNVAPALDLHYFKIMNFGQDQDHMDK